MPDRVGCQSWMPPAARSCPRGARPADEVHERHYSARHALPSRVAGSGALGRVVWREARAGAAAVEARARDRRRERREAAILRRLGGRRWSAARAHDWLIETYEVNNKMGGDG